MRLLFSLLTLLPLVACADASVSERGELESISQSKHAIVNGEASTADQDAVVMISHDQLFTCTGTLITPNLVLTAHHCVAYVERTGPCGVVKADFDPRSLTVSLGVDARAGKGVERGSRILAPTNRELCGADIALVLLERRIPGAMIAEPRFSPIAAGDTNLRAVGYGDDGSGGGFAKAPTRAQRTDVTITRLGPVETSYQPKSGGPSIPYRLTAGQFATTESTCVGDSGGPLLDAEGKIVGVTSSGIDDACIDRPTLWTALGAHADFINKEIGYASKYPDAPIPEPKADPTPVDPGPSTPVDYARPRQPTQSSPDGGGADGGCAIVRRSSSGSTMGSAESRSAALLLIASLVGVILRRRTRTHWSIAIRGVGRRRARLG